MNYTGSIIFRSLEDKANSIKGEVLIDRYVGSRYYGHAFFHDDNDRIIFLKTRMDAILTQHLDNSMIVGTSGPSDQDKASVWYNTNSVNHATNTSTGLSAMIQATVDLGNGSFGFNKIYPYSITDNIYLDTRFTTTLSTKLASDYSALNTKIDNNVKTITDTATATNKTLSAHENNHNNPHAVTLTQLKINYLASITGIGTSISSGATGPTTHIPNMSVINELNTKIHNLETYTNKLKVDIHDGTHSKVLSLTGGHVTGSITGDKTHTISGFGSVFGASVNDFAEWFTVPREDQEDLENRRGEEYAGRIVILDYNDDGESYRLLSNDPDKNKEILNTSMTPISMGVVTDEGYVIGNYVNDNNKFSVPVGLKGRVRPYVSGKVIKGQVLYFNITTGICSTSHGYGIHHPIGIAVESKHNTEIERVRMMIR